MPSALADLADHDDFVPDPCRELLQSGRRRAGMDAAVGFDPHQLMARMNARSKFHVMLPNFIRFTNTRGGIRAMFVPEPVPQKKEGLLYREF